VAPRLRGAPAAEKLRYSLHYCNGCLDFWPFIAFHSKKPSTGTMQRRLRIDDFGNTAETTLGGCHEGPDAI
jgi:hypothetical protein